MRLVDNFTGGLPPLVDNFGGGLLPGFGQPGGPPTDGGRRVSISLNAEKLAMRLRDNRYGIDTDKNGAAIIQETQAQCFAALKGLESSPEGQAISQRPEQKYLLPAPDAKCPPALAPQELWGMLLAVQQASAELSDTDLVRDLLSECLGFLKERLSAHYLLTGQNSSWSTFAAASRRR
jgi:hypothetical protein